MTRRRGIFLISVMFIAVVLAMLVISALATTSMGLGQGRHQARRQAAERAIRTGMDYAIARVRATPGGWWRAAGSRQLQLNGMSVREDDGQVEGWVRDGAHWSRFRFNFNRQDGSGGADGLPDAATLSTMGLSCNNLPFNSELAVPGQAGSIRFQLPPHCLLLSIEGACGPGSQGSFQGQPATLRAEMVLQLSNLDTQLYDSVASSTGDLNFVVQAGQNVTFQAVGTGQGRLRSKAGLSVTDSASQGAPLVSPKGEIRTANNGNSVASTIVASNIGRQQENPNDAFYSVALDSAPQAGVGAVSMRAGVYEVDLVNGQPEVKYFEMSYADYKQQRLAGTLTGGSVVDLDNDIQLNVLDRPGQDGVEVHFTKDTTVEAVGTLNSLAVVPSKGAFQEGEVPAGGGGGIAPIGQNATIYLALLANKIQAELSPGLVTSGPNMAISGAYTVVSQPFASVLTSYGGAGTGNLNTGGADLTFHNNGLHVGSVGNYNNSWDGLPGIYNFQHGALQLAQHLWLNLPGDPSKQAALEAFMGVPVPPGFGGANKLPPDIGFEGYVDLPETLETDPNKTNDPTDPATGGSEPTVNSSGLAVKDLKVRLERAGNSGEPVTLRGAGDLVLAGMLEGHGGAIVAQGDISLLGNGVDLQASQAAASSVNLYSTGNILVDGFAFDDSNSRYNDINLKGVMFSWGDITINAGKTGSPLSWGNFSLKGAMVAFGRDPADPSAPASSRRIQVTSHHAELTFDPAYLFNLQDSPVNENSHLAIRAYHQK